MSAPKPLGEPIELEHGTLYPVTHGTVCPHCGQTMADDHYQCEAAAGVDDCDACENNGYAPFVCDGVGHPGAELQACDNCQDDNPLRDDVAAVNFVRQLERGDKYAVKVARFLLTHGAPESEEGQG